MLSKWVESKEEADETHGNERLTYFWSKQYVWLAGVYTATRRRKIRPLSSCYLFIRMHVRIITAHIMKPVEASEKQIQGLFHKSSNCIFEIVNSYYYKQLLL